MNKNDGFEKRISEIHRLRFKSKIADAITLFLLIVLLLFICLWR